MSMVRWRIAEDVRTAHSDIDTHVSFGYITKFGRIKSGFAKSHTNDAFVIAVGVTQKRGDEYFVKQVRRSNRKLFRGARSHIKNTAPRFVHGFQRYDKVVYNGIECFVFSRRIRGYFELRGLNREIISHTAKSNGLILIESFNTLLVVKKLRLLLAEQPQYFSKAGGIKNER